MITILEQGSYALIETHTHTRILLLGIKAYAWIHAGIIGEILVASHRSHETDHILATGKYRLYNVQDEPHFSDMRHLELFVGDGKWQGYLLPNGLPNGVRRRKIIATREVITQAAHYISPTTSASSTLRS